MRIKAIINPRAGARIMRGVSEQARLLLEGEGWLAPIDTRYAGADWPDKGDDWIREPFDILYVAGGDGTLHRAIALMKGNGVDVPVAYLPTGSMNDMGHNLHLPRNAAAFHRMIQRGKTRRIDLGRVGDTYFHYVVAGGALARVAVMPPQSAKNRLGRVAYYVAAVRHLPRLLAGTRVAIEWEGGHAAREALIFTISNAPMLAGFPHMAPCAEMDDGLLDVCVIGKPRWYGMVPLFFRLLAGTHITHPGVSYFQAASVTVKPLSKRPPPLIVDGEPGPALPVRVEIAPQALSILVP